MAQERWLLRAGLLFLAIICLLPLLRLALEVAAALAGDARTVVLQTLLSADALRATRHTIEVGLGGTLLAVLYGLGLALLVTLTPVRARRWLVFAFVLQALLAPQVVALAWLQLWLPLRELLVSWGWRGLEGAGNPLQSAAGIVLLLGLHYAPLVFLAVRVGLLNLPPEVIEAARVSGAAPGHVLRRIILPLLLPALTAGAALAFVSCIGNFGIAAFLGIPADYLVLPTLIYRELSGFGPSAMPAALALSALVGVLAALGVAAQRISLRAGHYRVLAQRLSAPPFHLGRWQTPVNSLALGLVSVLLLAPLGALLAKSLSPALGVGLRWDNLSWEHYRYVAWHNESTLRAFGNSISLALGSTLVLAVVSVILAYQLEYRRSVWVRRVLPLVELPYVIPGVVLAMAMILLYLKPLPVLDISLFNTLWIIFLAYLARFMTIQLRPVQSGFAQLPHDMLEAAEVFGASFFSRLRRIILPLILPAVTAGALLVVLLSMNELTVSALLWATGSETLGVVVFGMEQGGESAAASAVAVLSIVLTLAVMLMANWLGRSLPQGVLPWRA